MRIAFQEPAFIASVTGRYGLMVCALAASSLLRWLMPDVLSRAPYLGFYPAVVVAAILGGVGPGLVATFGSLLLVNFIFVQFNFLDYGLQMRNVIWILGGIGVSFLAGKLRRAHERLQLSNLQLEQRMAERKQAEEALRASEERFRVTQELSPDGFIVFHPERNAEGQVTDFTWVYENAAVARMNGTDPKKIVGRRLLETFPANEGTLFMEAYRQVAETGIPAILEDSYQGETINSRTWFRTAVVRAGEDIAVHVQDITERKRAEEAVRRREADLNEAQRLAHIGSWNWDAKTDVTTGSDELLRIYGFDPALQKMPNFKDQRGRCYPVEDWEGVNAAVQKTLETGVGYKLEVQAIRDGKPIWVTTRGEAVRDAANQIIGLRGTVQDSTDRRQVEEALKETEQRFRLALRSAPVSVAVQDRDLRYIWAYNQRMARPDEIIGKFDSEIFTAEEAARITKIKRRVLDEGVDLREQMWLERSRSRIFLDMCWEPVRDDKGNIVGVASATVDLTPIKTAEEAVHQSQQTFSELIERAPFGIYVVDSEFRVAHMNASSQEGAFRNVRPVIGRNFAEAMRILWPEQVAAEIIGHFRHTLETGKPYFSPRFTNPRNDILIVESYEWELHRMTLPDGQHGVICYYYDSTKLREAEASLRESDERLRFALEAAELGTWDLDLVTGKAVRSLRHDQIFGYQELQQEWTLEIALRHIFPEDRQKVQEAHTPAEGKTKMSVEARVRRSDGSVRWITSHGRFHFDGDGRPVRIIGVVADITERKQAEERLTADIAALTRMHALSGRVVETSGIEPILQETMDASVAIVQAEKGTLQLLEGDTLRIVAHHGHERSFLDFFAAAENVASVCGEATRRGERVVVPDVETSPLFVGTPSLPVLRAAGVRAVQSTPLLTRGGRLLGVLTTQWSTPQTPDEHNLWRLDLLTRQAADFIERQQAEEGLRDSELRFRTMANAIPQLAWVAKADGYIYWYNQRWYEYTGTTPEQMEGWGWQSVHDPNELPKVLERWRASIATGEPFDMIFPLKGSDGAFRPFLTRVMPLRDEQGCVQNWFGTNTDITDQKRAEEALRESERMYRAIGESIDYGVWICDPEGRNIYASDSFLRLVGMTQQQCSDFGWGDVLHPEDADRTIAAWKECVRTGGNWDIEHRFRGVDGEWHPVLARGVPVRNEQGQISSWAGINLDISSLKRTEEALKASLREKEVLLKEIHHRVKNNMQVISSLVDLQADQVGDAAIRSVLQDVTNRVRSMALVHEKLYQSADMARIEFAEYTQTLLGYLWRAHGNIASGIRLVLDLEPVALSVNAAVPCGLILNELATNALKHAFNGRDSGEVIVSLRSDAEGQVHFRVRDNGIGLPVGLDWRKAKSLGLSVVQILTKQLSATMKVSVDQGTEFSIDFRM